MKNKEQIKKFLKDNYIMINSLMSKEERICFQSKSPVDIIIDEIDRQIKEENSMN